MIIFPSDFDWGFPYFANTILQVLVFCSLLNIKGKIHRFFNRQDLTRLVFRLKRLFSQGLSCLICELIDLNQIYGLMVDA
jgi:hypothetical protein